MAHYLESRNARTFAAGQAAWDNASPPEDEPDIEGELRESFAAALAGDVTRPAVWAYGCSWLKTRSADAADVLADALSDDRDFMHRAMVILADAAKDGNPSAQELIAEAGAAWARGNS